MNTQLHEVKDLYTREALLQQTVYEFCIHKTSWSF